MRSWTPSIGPRLHSGSLLNNTSPGSRTQRYQPSTYSVMMHGRDLNFSLTLDEPTEVSYMVRGRIYMKPPILPTDQVSETACQGEWVEYDKGHPLIHMEPSTIASC